VISRTSHLTSGERERQMYRSKVSRTEESDGDFILSPLQVTVTKQIVQNCDAGKSGDVSKSVTSENGFSWATWVVIQVELSYIFYSDFRKNWLRQESDANE
jgi:hypothetical protein